MLKIKLLAMIILFSLSQLPGIPHSFILIIIILCLLHTYGFNVSLLLETHSARTLQAIVQKPSNSNSAN